MQPGGMSDALVEEAKSEERTLIFSQVESIFFLLFFFLNNSSSRANERGRGIIKSSRLQSNLKHKLSVVHIKIYMQLFKLCDLSNFIFANNGKITGSVTDNAEAQSVLGTVLQKYTIKNNAYNSEATSNRSGGWNWSLQSPLGLF